MIDEGAEQVLSPQQQANLDAAKKLMEASIAKVKRRHLRLGVRVVDSILSDPFRSAYDRALTNKMSALADAYIDFAVGFLSCYFEDGMGPQIRGASVQGVQVVALLLAKQKKGDRIARALLNRMAQAGLTGPNPG